MPKFDVDETLVRKLAGLLEETGLNEIEYETGDQRIRVTRGGGNMMVAATQASPAMAIQAAPAAPAASGAQPDVPPAGALLSPMVGTAYVSAEPGGAPFVKVGDTVTEGQTLLIIEAMKVMNPIPAPRSGKVTQILISDAQPVEYGEVLMVVQ